MYLLEKNFGQIENRRILLDNLNKAWEKDQEAAPFTAYPVISYDYDGKWKYDGWEDGNSENSEYMLILNEFMIEKYYREQFEEWFGEIIEDANNDYFVFI
jgi:hypothetical protein